MELVPLVITTFIVFSIATVVFILGSFLIYKFKNGSTKKNPGMENKPQTTVKPVAHRATTVKHHNVPTLENNTTVKTQVSAKPKVAQAPVNKVSQMPRTEIPHARERNFKEQQTRRTGYQVVVQPKPRKEIFKVVNQQALPQARVSAKIARPFYHPNTTVFSPQVESDSRSQSTMRGYAASASAPNIRLNFK